MSIEDKKTPESEKILNLYKNENQILEKLNETVLNYAMNGDKLGIDDLLKLQDRIAAYSFFLGNCYSEANASNLKTYTDRKLKINKAFLTRKAEKLNDKSISDKMATEYAIEDSAEEMMKEMNSEIRTQKLKISIERADKVLSTISQRVSRLKMEKNESRNQK